MKHEIKSIGKLTFTEVNERNTDVFEDGLHIGYIYQTPDLAGDSQNVCWVYYDHALWTTFWEARGTSLDDAKRRLPRELQARRACAQKLIDAVAARRAAWEELCEKEREHNEALCAAWVVSCATSEYKIAQKNIDKAKSERNRARKKWIVACYHERDMKEDVIKPETPK